METLQLREEFYWTGIVDDQLRVFDIIMYTEFGTTYNSYILKAGDKTVLFETAKAKFFDESPRQQAQPMPRTMPPYLQSADSMLQS